MGEAPEKKCFVVMAGRSTDLAQTRFCGWTDHPLAIEGRQAVLGLRERLIEKGVRLPKVWFVSDRKRAISTFEIMTAGMHAPVVTLLESLREMNFGQFENLTWDDLPADFQQLYERGLSTPAVLQFPGGESFLEFCDRVTRGLGKVLSQRKDNSEVGIIGHQGSMRLCFMIAQGLAPEAFFDEVPKMGEGQWTTLSASMIDAWRVQHLQGFLDEIA